MEVTAKEDPVDDKSSVLTIRIMLNNVGYRSLTPAAKGLEVSVKRLAASGQDRRLQWSRGELVFDEVDILAVYKEEGATDYKGTYRLDRGGVYHETCALTVDRGHVYLIQVALWLEDADLQIEYCYHVSPDSSGTVASLAVAARTELQSANQSIQAT